jgi:2-polyprenyl-3-methyl-5-hydroxy-6-metoxy-1,4-benzoquinol methylase
MSKYDFALDMTSDNSNSVILKNIAPNSKVLELGCAHGRMTKYMKETLHCTVDTVELDEEAGQVAANWANKSFAGNVEDLDIWDELNGMGCNNYDYLIFADVLEHLHDPKRVLTDSKKLLAPNGSIWISIPNVAHNAVIVDLLNYKFIYREIGLLDNTHLRFFTVTSLLQLVADCKLDLVTRIDLKCPLANTEFNNSYDDVPPWVADFLRKRELGEVYQFVWELKHGK